MKSMRTSGLLQFSQCRRTCVPSVRSCQAEAAPKVRVSLDGKLRERLRNPRGTAAIDEPQRAAQTLVERTLFITREALWMSSPSQVVLPFEKPFVETPPVEPQPFKQWIHPPKPG